MQSCSCTVEATMMLFHMQQYEYLASLQTQSHSSFERLH